MINIFYVKKEYERKSGGRVGAYYEITDKKTFKRTDLGSIEKILEEGDEVCIKPATAKQLAVIDKMLSKK